MDIPSDGAEDSPSTDDLSVSYFLRDVSFTWKFILIIRFKLSVKWPNTTCDLEAKRYGMKFLRDLRGFLPKFVEYRTILEVSVPQMFDFMIQ